MNLRIGTSGWSYPSGQGTWNGIFYPARRRGQKLDELAYYAERFDTVEVNSSFYRPPTPEMARSWVERTPAGFEFSLKLYQKFTHLRPIGRGPLPRPGVASDAGGDDARRLQQADVDEFRRALDPIASAGKLGALLAQFPPSFKNTPAGCEYLAGVLRAFGGYPVAVELRHRSWSDDLATTLGMLEGFGAAWAQIDEPKFRFSIQQNYLPNITTFYYMRLHGRNVGQWWRHEKSEDRYNYLYSAEELQPFADTADAARRLVKKMYLYMNNHFAAKSVANAVMLKNQLGLEMEGEYPPDFIARYPELRDIVTVSASLPVLRSSS